MYISRRKHKRTQSLAEDVAVCEMQGEVRFPDSVPLPNESGDAPPEQALPVHEPAEKKTKTDTEQPLTPEREQNATGQSSEKNNIAVPSDPQVLDQGKYDEEMLSYEKFTAQNSSSGVLRIQASAGSESIPLANVKVVVYKDLSDGRHIFYTVTTNADGVADSLVLPAPPGENSVIGNGKPPYASYSLTAERDGMIGESVENVPIFAGIKSIQPVILENIRAEV